MERPELYPGLNAEMAHASQDRPLTLTMESMMTPEDFMILASHVKPTYDTDAWIDVINTAREYPSLLEDRKAKMLMLQAMDSIIPEILERMGRSGGGPLDYEALGEFISESLARLFGLEH